MGSVNTSATPTTRVTSTQSHISPHTSGRTRPRMGSVNTPATPTTGVASTQSHISPYTSGRTRPRMGSVNTPATPTTCVTSTQSHMTVLTQGSQFSGRTIQWSKPSEPGKCAICDIRSGL
ncbi:unnamed protein product [Prunus brigantina]